MKTILCEKPLQAEDIARCLDKGYEKKNGYFTALDYHITYAFGHLLELKIDEPKDIKWDLNKLPIFSDKFKYELVEEKKHQFFTVRKLLLESNVIFIGTDAGREGELIAREILDYCKIDKSKCYRIWSSISMTPEVLKECLNKSEPLSNYDCIFYAAKTRQYADNLLGINLSRFFTLKAQSSKAYSVGRVQTPTLRIIVEREKEIEAFKPKDFYIIKATFTNDKKTSFEGKYIPCDEIKDETLPDMGMNKENALEVFNLIKQHTKTIVKTIKKETVNEKSPGLLTLTDLQILANKKFNYTSTQTLAIAQSLYEKHKCISYPRSESNHLADENKDLAASKLQIFAPELLPNLEKPGKRVFDSTKLTDHHAIIPLAEYRGSDEKEANIFNFIKDFFIMAFMDDHVFSKTEIILQIGEKYNFLATGKTIIEMGWRSVLQNQVKDVILPDTEQGETLETSDPTCEAKKTLPPKRHTEASLLNTMKRYKLATVATRDSIIKNLYDKGYFLNEKKNIIASEKGKDMIRVLQESEISKLKNTIVWEGKLEEISKLKNKEQGKSSFNEFISEINDFINDQFRTYKNVELKSYNPATSDMMKLARKLAREKKRKDFNAQNNSFDYIKGFLDECINQAKEGIDCPCGKGKVFETPKTFKCSCDRIVFKETFGKKISQKQALELFEGKQIKMMGCKSQKGKVFNATVELIGDKGKLNIVSFIKK